MAQVVERSFRKRQGAGSIPAWGSFRARSWRFRSRRQVGDESLPFFWFVQCRNGQRKRKAGW